MELKKIKIENLRAIRELELDIYDFTSLIGANNNSKSTILRAIELFLSQKKPLIEEIHNNITTSTIIIECTFDNLEEWERNRPGVSNLVYNNKLILRASYNIETDFKPKFEAFKAPVVIDGWDTSWSNLSEQIREFATEIEITNGTHFRSAANKRRLEEHIIENHDEIVSIGEPEWSDDSISINAALQQALPQVILIPAVKDASDESSTSKQKTAFSQLMNHIVIPAIQRTPEYQSLISSVTALQCRLGGEDGYECIPHVDILSSQLTDRIGSIINARAIVTMQTPDAEKLVLSNAGIDLDDGVQTPIHLKGHGTQRALIFALIEFLAKYDSGEIAELLLNIENEENNQDAEVENNNQEVEVEENVIQQRSTILLFEEPELYLHPHVIRELKKALKKISLQNKWQVILTTHSPFMIDIAENTKSLILIKRNIQTNLPEKVQLDEDPFINHEGIFDEREALRATLDFHPTVLESFFAKRVVLVEGDSEIAMFKLSKEVLERMNEYDEEIEKKIAETTFVSCSGKWTILPIARLMNKFDIPFKVIHDKDQKGRTQVEINSLPRFHPYFANQRIEDLVGVDHISVSDDTLEHIFWPDPTNRREIKSDKPFTAWKRVKEMIEEGLDDYVEFKNLFKFVYDIE